MVLRSTDKKQTAENSLWMVCRYAESNQSFDKIKHRHTHDWVGDGLKGMYDCRIDIEKTEWFQCNSCCAMM